MVLENQNLSGGNLTVYVRNATSTGAILDAIYVDGNLVVQDDGTQLFGNAVTTLDLTAITGSTFTVGQEVTLVTEEGSQIKFKVK